MANWKGQKVNISDINGGEEYDLDDAVELGDFNSIVNNSLYASNIAENVSSQLAGLGANDRVEFKGSNPNLLINPSFNINQKGLTEYKDFSQYSVDKWWLTTANGVVTKINDGINLKALDSGHAYVNQYIIGAYNILKGKQLTFSACINGQIHYATGTMLSAIPTERTRVLQIESIPNSTAVGVWCEKNNGDLIVQFGVLKGNNYNINWAKLEIGPIATTFNPSNVSDDKTSSSSAGVDVYNRTTNAYNSYSNPNLLINGDFRINQRGQTSYTGTVYGVDRWIGRDAIVSVIDKGVKITQNGVQWYGINQSIEDVDLFKGKVVTLSVKFKNLNIGNDGLYIGMGNSSVPYTRGTTISTIYPIKSDGIYSLTFKIPETLNNKYLNVVIQNTIGEITTTNSFEVEWAKLELGSVATDCISKPYVEELALCQRYFLKISGTSTAGLTGLVYTAGEYADINLKVPVPMCRVPSITINSLPKIRYEGSGDIAVTDVQTSTIDNNTVLLKYYGTFKGNTVCATYGLSATLDAELI